MDEYKIFTSMGDDTLAPVDKASSIRRGIMVVEGPDSPVFLPHGIGNSNSDVDIEPYRGGA